MPIREAVSRGDPEINGDVVVSWETVEETVELGDGVNPGDAEGQSVIDTVGDIDWSEVNDWIGVKDFVIEEDEDDDIDA